MRKILVIAFFLWMAAPAPAKPAPEIALKDLAGQKQRLSALQGNIVVLNFWAMWCGPCQEELPLLSTLSADYANDRVRFVAVSIDEDKSRTQISAFLTQRKINLETWTGANTGTMAKAGLGDIVPSTMIVDASGEVIARITGEAREEDIRTRVDWLLKGRPGVAPASVVDRH